MAPPPDTLTDVITDASTDALAREGVTAAAVDATSARGAVHDRCRKYVRGSESNCEQDSREM
jgi:hypothetical protein